MILIHRWHTKQIDYVQAFPQAPAEKDLYLKVPAGFEVEGGTRDEYALKLHKNVYGQKKWGEFGTSTLPENWSMRWALHDPKLMSVSSTEVKQCTSCIQMITY